MDKGYPQRPNQNYKSHVPRFTLHLETSENSVNRHPEKSQRNIHSIELKKNMFQVFNPVTHLVKNFAKPALFSKY